ncbi:putative bifunctional diguanylate cyclase/phosphodiesterase [Rhizobium rhizogenes]|uniref:Kinase protein n=1 Tax=Rhizobium rhizogenes (strain K84 / ATCC BAA-868) TaxID=311403 RepID=B9JND8_RHIR8|nr:bifunctional diguanylate cyclase/phosphodiesterase [Rhizobium rhizogenes]ACM29069.1 kinase protein [Rhizobium rhizogenes K84]NTF63867.1 bifunctional diguanylate cyclase/phosphodiesterase [Rhizobium rhizogenes]NTG02809.1 bifunctional diguanylate cyclase/phosphodiesterase [Rhizobium rhizogenes]NTG09873.1 bifunctional diguanylate cyclase/phosphodiesterase [Rhizobium rhizogenes]NTG75980.1 bifunctional diguanylate cyclase/phosphodiesterase [Rhizobium rhizogenes]
MPENRANWPLLVPQKSEFDDRPEALFSLWGLDFKLIDCSEELKDRAGTASLTAMTLWEIYPSLANPAFADLVQFVVDTGHSRRVRLNPSMSAGQDLLLFHTRDGLAVIEIDSSGTNRATLPEDQERARLLHQATHDVLTGLPNRRQFSQELDRLLPTGDEAGLALMQIDLDDFKPVNDTMGHGAGDIVLRLAAERISRTLAHDEVAYRLAGDEFAIIQVAAQQPMEAERLAEALVAEFKKPFVVDGISLFVGASIGVAIAPRDGNEGEQLMKAADVALYAAKKDGRRRARTFDPGMLVVLEQRELLRRSLRVALQRDEFFLEYQPLVEPPFTVVGFEALLRWRHPSLGIIPPIAFIPMAEADGLMSEIGEWILEQACREALTWPVHYTVAVNLSPAEFLTPGFTDRVAQTLDVVGFPSERLELEITESVLLERTINNLDTLNTLNVLGIQISLDDFGTEYSSLSYLKNFPFDNIKIDKYFIKDLLRDGKSQTIVRSVIALAHGLDMRVTAEGVETAQQATWLQSEGCDRLQGYFLSPPMGADRLADFIAQRSRTHPTVSFDGVRVGP